MRSSGDYESVSDVRGRNQIETQGDEYFPPDEPSTVDILATIILIGIVFALFGFVLMQTHFLATP
jgi:hypothetical protein